MPKTKTPWCFLSLSVVELKIAGVDEPILLHKDNLFQD
jgi:hypothetical protein